MEKVEETRFLSNGVYFCIIATGEKLIH